MVKCGINQSGQFYKSLGFKLVLNIYIEVCKVHTNLCVCVGGGGGFSSCASDALVYAHF